MVLPPVSLLPSPTGSATDGITEGRAVLVLVLPLAFLHAGGLVDEDLSKDNSSSARASLSLEIMGSFPFLQTTGGST